MSWLAIPPEHISPFRKEIRGKLRATAAMGKILHFLYLAVKNRPEKAREYESIHHMLKDVPFVQDVLRAEASAERLRADSARNIHDYYRKLCERGYHAALDALDILWEMANYRGIDTWNLLLRLLSLDKRCRRVLEEYYVQCPIGPCRPYRIKATPFLIIEYEPAERGLARLTIYWGTLQHSELCFREARRIGLFARFSLNSTDAMYLYGIQQNKKICAPSNWLIFYLPLLRVRRTSYRQIASLSQDILNEELRACLSELWLSPDDISEIRDRQARANLLSVIPLIFPSDALCIPGVGEGYLIKLSGGRAVVAFDDIKMEAYFSYNSVFPLIKRSGNYLILFAVPVLVPKLVILLGMWELRELGQIERRERGVSRFSDMFPTIEEISIPQGR